MKTKTGNRILKILCIAAVFVLMLILSGCRTRISNNNEVNNVMYDDGGYMQEEYDMRREDLDLSTAKKPVFTGFGNPEEEEDEDYDFGEDGQALEDYEPDEFEDEVDDSNPPLPNSSTTTTPGTGTVKRRVITNNAPVVITVTLNPNGGKCKTKTLAVRKDGKYGILPTPTRDDYTFIGWYTKKEDGKGKKVTSTTKVASTTNHTLYAHWKKGEEKKEEDTKPADTTPTTPTTPTEETKQEFTVTFDLNAADATFTEGGGNLTVKDGETYGSLPKAERPKYKFKGWSTSSSGTSTVSSGDKVTQSHTLYAVWDEDSKGYWEAQLADSVKAADKYSYKSLDGNDSFLQDSGLSKGKNPDYLVVFGDESDAEKADTKEKNPDHITILYIPKSDASGKKELIHKIYVFNYLYMGGIDVAQAEEDLGVSDEDYSNNIGVYESSWIDDGGGSGDGGDGGDGGAGEGTEP